MTSRLISIVVAIGMLTAVACDRANTPQAVPVPPVTVHRSPTAASAPSAEEVAVLKDSIGGSKPTPSATTAPSAAKPPSRTPDASTRSMGIPTPSAPAQPLKYDVPAEWVSVKPSSAIRKAQWTLPRAEADADDGVVILFYFGAGQGGGIPGNVNRWKGMFSTEEGKPLSDGDVKQESYTANELNVTVVEISGRYTESSMLPGAAPAGPRSNHRMIAAIVETADGSWYFRCTAPAATMAKHEAGIRSLLKSVRQ